MARTFRTLAVMLTLALFATIALGFWSFLTPGESKLWRPFWVPERLPAPGGRAPPDRLFNGH